MDFLEAFRAHAWFFLTTLFIVGLTVGSFLNVVIHRLPKMMEVDWRQQCLEYLYPDKEHEKPPKYTLVVPRSACPACGHKISAMENIPVLSYVVLGGKCKACKTKISPRYPAVEIITGATTAFLGWHFGVSVAAWAAIVFAWVLIALTFIDADTTLLPDDLTLPLLWLGLLVNLFGVFTSLPSAVIGAAAGYLSLWSVYWGFKLLTGKEGMGFGDFKLLAALGAWLGWQMLPQIILLSALVGAVVGVVGIALYGREKGAKIPFGPYLAAAGLIAMVYGPQLNAWYWALGKTV